MKQCFGVLALLAVAIILAHPPATFSSAGPDEARAILDQTLDRKYQDLELKVHLVKTSKTGKERPMDLTVKMKNSPEMKKTLAVFTAPPEVAGITSLAWDYTDPAQTADRWFKLSGMEYVKCLGQSCQNLEEKFGFSTDIFAINLDEADHKLLGEETIDGAPCFKIESKAKDQGNPAGARFITWVDKEKLVARKVEVYDKTGTLSQMSVFTEFKLLGGHWWETKGELAQYNTGKKLRFEITEANVNTGIPDAVFDKPKVFSVQGDGKP